MSLRPEEIQHRLRSLDEIGDVVGALRAIAASHASSAETAMQAITAYAGTVTHALAISIAAAAPHSDPKGSGLLLVVGAAQGFCGAYPEHIAEVTQSMLEPGMGLIVVGARTADTLRTANLPVLWSDDLPGHPAAIPALASRTTDVLVEQSSHHPGPIRALTGTPHGEHATTVSRLFPPEPPKGVTSQIPPLMTLPADELLTGLLKEALFASVARVMMQGAETEARARVEAMARAQNNLRSRRKEVEQAYQQARQEQMTTEMIELSAGRT
ncbi:MAG: F0F1 ATP synthase subunit gamma [Rhodobacterales bacterium]|jgi:F-type H+-transporting ATPase subunit gamma|nr:F0F1 ATP synthase subunit gamma [Rhodobacterales bacterium]